VTINVKGMEKQGVSLTQDESGKGEETVQKEVTVLASILKLISLDSRPCYTLCQDRHNGDEGKERKLTFLVLMYLWVGN
jgi:hypothetical protein